MQGRPCTDSTHVRSELDNRCRTCNVIKTRAWRVKQASGLRKKQRQQFYSQLLRAWRLPPADPHE